MIQDLYVDGCSYASGWGKGLEKTLFRPKWTNSSSWVDTFTEFTNTENLWNHSLVVKPLDMQIIDIKNFCDQYLKKYKTYNRLFVCVEFSSTTYKSFQTVKVRDGEFKNEIVYPVILAKAQDIETENYIIHYVRKTNDYLDVQEPMFVKMDEDTIDPEDRKRTEQSAKTWFFGRHNAFVEHTEYTFKCVAKIKKFLYLRNIPFVMYSAGVSDNHPYKEFLDFALSPLSKDNRLVPLSAFTGLQLSAKYSLEQYANHPDENGHFAIGKHLYDWVTKHDLTKKPNSSIISI